MDYKNTSPLAVIEGGTGSSTLTGVLVGNGTSPVTASSVTQYNVQVGGASNALVSVAPSATSGVALVSQGSSANPAFGTVVVAGGGTGATTLTGVLTGNGTSAVTANAVTQYTVLLGDASNGVTNVSGVGTAAQVLTSNGAGVAPTWQDAGGGGGITTINGDSGSVTGDPITLTGGTSGAVFTGSSSTMTQSFDFLALPTTTSTDGQITLNGSRFLHAYGGSLDNLFLGKGAGNFTLSNPQGANNGVGFDSLKSLTSGYHNQAMGRASLQAVTTGFNNIGIGQLACYQLTTGNDNIILGYLAGSAYTSSESSNIVLGFNNTGTASESNRLRIGTDTGTGDGELDASYISGITGKTSGSGSAVFVNASNLLGTSTSSIRFKENIKDMKEDSSDIFKLRPVTFNYKISLPHVDKEDACVKQYGLIAEEVEKIMPGMVIYDKEGNIESLRYQHLAPMLLNELQKALKRIEVLESKLGE